MTEQSTNGNEQPRQPSRQPVPFVIQRIGRGNKREIEEITKMCIDVFFNEQTAATETGEEKKRVPPWKSLQLAYLGNMQTGDLLSRNAFRKDQLVDLIIARRVYPADSPQVNGNAVGDLGTICNPEYLAAPNENGYVTGEIIGYCEVSEKNFGLGGKFQTQQSSSPQPKRRRGKSGEKPRPYLSNLSVVEYARQSGVGSRLLDEGEDAVRGWNAGHTEIVLQVEEDNPTAIQFYKRRGYEFVFADPTCRRYDTSGIILRETRITKYALIKRLDEGARGSEEDETSDDGSSLIQKLRGSFFVQR